MEKSKKSTTIKLLIIQIQFNSKIMRKYTPDNIDDLRKNDVFVFGSNAAGIHGKGAAAIAHRYFGAKYGVAEGLQGESYAIITKKDWKVEKSSTLEEICEGIRKFLLFAVENPNLKFYVTKLGSSLAGYEISEIKSLFQDLVELIPGNVILPKEYEVRE